MTKTEWDEMKQALEQAKRTIVEMQELIRVISEQRDKAIDIANHAIEEMVKRLPS